MVKTSLYRSKDVDENDVVNWSEVENHTWSSLIKRQLQCIEGKACDEFMHGLDKLQLPLDHIPQLDDVSKKLDKATGWQCYRVPALINFDQFFNLLAQRKFPVATFIRRPDEFEYLREPDIFHEIFGHCGMLTDNAFANFTQKYGEIGLKATKEQRVYLARLYWFTVEFGLLRCNDGIRIYGGGILSSPAESQYVYSDKAKIVPLQVLNVLRTPYRIDIMQPIYHTINSIDDLSNIANMDLLSLVNQAKNLGLHAPLYPQ